VERPLSRPCPHGRALSRRARYNSKSRLQRPSGERTRPRVRQLPGSCRSVSLENLFGVTLQSDRAVRREAERSKILQSKEEVDLAFLAFGAALDAICMQPGKVPGQSVDEALFFHHFSFRTRVGQARKIANISEGDLHVEAVAANPNFYRTLRIGRNVLDRFVHHGTHPFDILRRKIPIARLFEKKIVKGSYGHGGSVLLNPQSHVLPSSQRKTALRITEVITATVI
jgi:hypothetical protein